MTLFTAAACSLTFLLLSSCDTGTGDNIKKPNANAPAPRVKPSLATFSDTLSKLDKRKPLAVAQAVELYEVLAPHDSTGADSAASALFLFLNNVVKSENDSLHKEAMDVAPLLVPANNTLTEKQKAIKTSLHAKRLKLVSDGEGGAYIVPAYETILPTVKAKTSAAVDNYLDLVAKEDTSPVFMDAGLTVEMIELADRLVMSEQAMTQPLPKLFAAEVTRLNRLYTNAILMGADNTPALEQQTTTLNEEFRKGYDYLLAKYPSSKAAAQINVWLTVVASGDKKKIDDFRRTIP